MASSERITVTLPVELVKGIDRIDRDRSRFITAAVEHELVTRHRDGLLRSVKSPHPETAELAETSIVDWTASLSPNDVGLVDMSGGTQVHWVEGQGWTDQTA